MNIDNRQMLPIGTILKGGEYCVKRYIASGGFGNTYEVEHTRLGKHMALKEFFMRGINLRQGTDVTVSVSDNRMAYQQMKDKFYKEAQRLARLQELHIVEVNDFFEENQTAYYVMRLIEGEALSAVMKRNGKPFTEQQVRPWLSQVLLALKCVHHQGIYHLDLKPGNIMLGDNGHCWLIDFGASKQLSAQESQTLSTSTGFCYTPGYAPSEQVEGSMKRIGPWTDFYALGATLYNLLSNERPPELSDVKYDGERAFHFPETVSADMRRLVLWMMQPDYPRRPQSVEEIEQMLQQPQRQSAQELKESPKAYQPAEELGTPTVLSSSEETLMSGHDDEEESEKNRKALKRVNVYLCISIIFSLYWLGSSIFPVSTHENGSVYRHDFLKILSIYHSVYEVYFLPLFFLGVVVSLILFVIRIKIKKKLG